MSLILAPAASGAASEPGVTCGSRSMYTVAHQDDSLLFQSPTLLQVLRSEGVCVRSVFLTAGDAGLGEAYWRSREEGTEAAYAEMVGLSDAWTSSTLHAAGHAIRLETLTADPRISLVFMRLPDGEVTGEGTPAYGFQSLRKLWNGGHSLSPSIPSITADDGSATYTYAELIETLAALMGEFEPTQIATQNYTEAFFEHGDHPDHAATGYFVKEAQATYGVPHRLRAYQGYDVSANPVNVTGALLAGKRAAFFTYGEHDFEVCGNRPECEESFYGEWLLRQYVTASETSGAVADAGLGQIAAAGATVTLDGSESSDESGAPLAYEWTQVLGPTVQVTGADTASPSFAMPDHPTLLTFSLTVRDGAAVSPPDRVNVRVPTDGSAPAAVVDPGQTVDSGARVELDGTGSWGPNSEPLRYDWAQTGGPPVALVGAATARPSFVAPTGPAALSFSLTVSNGVQTSAPATVAIAVKAPPPIPTPPPTPGSGTSPTPASPTGHAAGVPPTVTAPTVRHAFAGAAVRMSIAGSGDPSPTFSLAARPPAGLRLVATGSGRAALVGRPTGIGARWLTVVARNAAGTASRGIRLVVERRPKFARRTVRLGQGRRSRALVRVLASGWVAAACRGLPRGVACRMAGGRLVLHSRGRPVRAGRYRLRVLVKTPAGAVRLPLDLVVPGEGQVNSSAGRSSGPALPSPNSSA